MAYVRKEVSPEEIEKQKNICKEIAAKKPAESLYALVDTYGCQQNEADSELLRGWLQSMGYESTTEEDQADVIVVNTCAVREHAQMRVFGNVGALTKWKAAKSSRMIVLCGCMAQNTEARQKIKDSYRIVDLCFGPQDLWRFPELMEKALAVHALSGNKGRVFDDTLYEDGAVAEDLPRERTPGPKAWLSIMNGCNNFCSYCIVPYTRGRERSRCSENIIEEARWLLADGAKDITLLGQNVNSYGKGLEEGVDFSDLLRKLNDLPGDFRIRFMTSHPKDATEKLFQTIGQCEKVMPHIHLPVQSGSNRILKEMNRGYTAEKYLSQVELARKYIPNLVLTTDVIVGFPGETEEDFADTLRLTETVEFDSMFTFIYSPRPGTRAAELPYDISKEEIQNRFSRLVESANRISAKLHRAQEGKTLRVLIDGAGRDGENTLAGRTEGGRLVHFQGSEALVGQWADVKITGSNTVALFGEIKGAEK